MKSALLRISFLAVLVVVISCSPAPSPTRASFTVEGMTCGSCSSAIITALSEMEGVETAAADHVAGTAEAVITSTDITPEQLAAEIEGLGFTVTETRTDVVDG